MACISWASKRQRKCRASQDTRKTQIHGNKTQKTCHKLLPAPSRWHDFAFRKEARFWKGNWNGAGGKLSPGETPEQAAAREVKEEICVDIALEDLQKIGEINFRNPADPDWGMYVHIFVATKWSGEPTESDEMRPEWLDPTKVIGVKTTWADLPHYFDLILKKQKFTGEFVYKADAKTLDHFHVEPVENF